MIFVIISVYVMYVLSPKYSGTDKDMKDEEQVGDNDEVVDYVVIGGGSEEDRGVEEELEMSGMGSNGILEYMEENCKCCFCYT